MFDEGWERLKDTAHYYNAKAIPMRYLSLGENGMGSRDDKSNGFAHLPKEDCL